MLPLAIYVCNKTVDVILVFCLKKISIINSSKSAIKLKN